MVLTTTEIVDELCKPGFLTSLYPLQFEGTAVAAHLGGEILVERFSTANRAELSAPKSSDNWYRESLPLAIPPGHFVLASVREILELPATISAEFKLSSTAARLGLWHSTAVWAHAGWQGQLTLELVNVSRRQTIVVAPGDKIGHIVFHKHAPVSPQHLYDGKYQKQAGVASAK